VKFIRAGKLTQDAYLESFEARPTNSDNVLKPDLLTTSVRSTGAHHCSSFTLSCMRERRYYWMKVVCAHAQRFGGCVLRRQVRVAGSRSSANHAPASRNGRLDRSARARM